MKIHRRALFFLVVAAIFLLMLPPTPPEYRWLNLVMAGISVFWAVLLWIEGISGRRGALDEPPGTDVSDDPSEPSDDGSHPD
jgi:hypothetical protein